MASGTSEITEILKIKNKNIIIIIIIKVPYQCDATEGGINNTALPDGLASIPGFTTSITRVEIIGHGEQSAYLFTAYLMTL